MLSSCQIRVNILIASLLNSQVLLISSRFRLYNRVNLVHLTHKALTLSSAAKMAKSAPYISIPGVANFRDIGGTPIASHPGKEVRRNIVFRSARPDISTSRGKKKLQMLAITHTYDLRSTQELSSSKSYDRSKLIWAGTTTRVSVPVFRPEEYAPDAVVARFAKHGASCEVRQLFLLGR